MKKILLYLAIPILFTNCKDDDDAKPSFEFKNQNLLGKINGGNWTYQEGTAETDGGTLRIALFLDQPEPVCDIFGFSNGDQVFFTVPNAVGVYALSFNLSGGGTGQTVTLFDIQETLNIICTEGAIEILTITSTEVTGRMDARSDAGSFVNGNFTATICQ
jgi:hypothetical protein